MRFAPGRSALGIAGLRSGAWIVPFARPIASGCETEVGRHRLVPSEAFGIIHGCFEGQCGDKANARRGHEQLANRIVMRECLHASIDVKERAVEMTACVQQRAECFG